MKNGERTGEKRTKRGEGASLKIVEVGKADERKGIDGYGGGSESREWEVA